MARIVCVEDQTEIREDIAAELKDAGHMVFEAENGVTGLSIIQNCNPDLIFCDINMPGMDGRRLLSEIRNNYPNLADIPFIFLSALNEREDIIAGKIEGADDYLVKPIDFDLLLATVESQLRQVQRMVNKRDQQFVRLYKTLSERFASQHDPNSKNAEPSAPDDVGSINLVTVTNQEIDLSEFHQAMVSRGHRVIQMESGLEFVRSLEQFSLDVCVVSFNTVDVQAPAVANLLSGAGLNRFPLLLVMPPSAQDVDGAGSRDFADTVRWPCDVGDLVRRVEVLSTMRACPEKQSAMA